MPSSSCGREAVLSAELDVSQTCVGSVQLKNR